jgi:hypothetical protein
LPTPRRITAQIRARLNHLYTLDRLETRYGRGQMELAEFVPPDQRDGSVWPGDGGRPAADGAGRRAGSHVNGHGVRPSAQASETGREGPDDGTDR